MSLRISTRQLCTRTCRPLSVQTNIRIARFSHATINREEKTEDPRLKEEIGDLIIEDQYAALREKYRVFS